MTTRNKKQDVGYMLTLTDPATGEVVIHTPIAAKTLPAARKAAEEFIAPRDSLKHLSMSVTERGES